jgi:hypothetical protein
VRVKLFFENGVLKLFWPEKDKVTGEWRKLHNKEVCRLAENLLVDGCKFRWSSIFYCLFRWGVSVVYEGVSPLPVKYIGEGE